MPARRANRRGALYFPKEKHTAEYRVLGQYHGVTDERVKIEVLARIGKSIKLLVCTSAFGKSSLTLYHIIVCPIGV